MASSARAELDTAYGPAILEDIYFTDLGHVMIKLYILETKTWINKRISSLDILLGKNKAKNLKTIKRKKSIKKNNI